MFNKYLLLLSWKAVVLLKMYLLSLLTYLKKGQLGTIKNIKFLKKKKNLLSPYFLNSTFTYFFVSAISQIRLG